MFWHKAQHFFAIAMGAFCGVFLGYCLWTVWDHIARPELYALNSAPWWVGIVLYGIGCALCELVPLAGWLFARSRAGKAAPTTPDKKTMDY